MMVYMLQDRVLIHKEFINEIKQIYYAQAKARGRTLIEHAFKQAYNGKDIVLIALLKKLLPDKIENDSKSGTNIFNLINQIQQDLQRDRNASLGVDNGNGLHERRTRPSAPDKEIS